MSGALSLLHDVASKLPRKLKPDAEIAMLRFLKHRTKGRTEAPAPVDHGPYDPVEGIDDLVALESVRRCAASNTFSWSDSDDEFAEHQYDGDDPTPMTQAIPTAPADGPDTPFAANPEEAAANPRRSPSVTRDAKRGRDGPDALAESQWRPGMGPMAVAIVVRALDSASDVMTSLSAAFDLFVTMGDGIELHTVGAVVQRDVSAYAASQRERDETKQQQNRVTATGPSQRPVVKVLVMIPIGSVAGALACDNLRRQVAEALAIQSRNFPLALVHHPDPYMPALQVSVAVIVDSAVDAAKARDAVLAPFRAHASLVVFDDAVVPREAFAALLYEMLMLFPVVLSPDALALLRASWAAAHRLTDVVRNFHIIVTTARMKQSEDEAGHLALANRRSFGSAAARAVQLCSDAAHASAEGRALGPTTPQYVAMTGMFETFYSALCKGEAKRIYQKIVNESAGTAPTQQHEDPVEAARHELAQFVVDGLSSVKPVPVPAAKGPGLELCPLIVCPSAPVPLVSRFEECLGRTLARGEITDAPQEGGSDAAHDEAAERGIFEEPHVSDASKVLLTLLREKSTLDKSAGSMPFDIISKVSRLSEDRVIKALFELRTRMLAVVNLTRRTARCVAA